MAGGRITQADIAQELVQMTGELNKVLLYAAAQGLVIELEIVPIQAAHGREVAQIAMNFHRTE